MIEELLHTGIQNALSPEYLAAAAGLDSVRAVQKQIEKRTPRGCSDSVQYSSTGRLLSASKQERSNAVHPNIREQITGNYGSIAERKEVFATVPGVSRGRREPDAAAEPP